MTIPARLYTVMQIDSDLDNQEQALVFRSLYVSIDDAKAACANEWQSIFEDENIGGDCPTIEWNDPANPLFAMDSLIEGSVECPGLIGKVYVITPHDIPAPIARAAALAVDLAHLARDGELLATRNAINDTGAEFEREAAHRYRFSMSGDDACSTLGGFIDLAREATGHAPANLIAEN